MNPKHLRELQKNEVLRKRLAKLIEELQRRDLVPEWNDPDWENDREPQLIRDSLGKALAAERKPNRKRTGKARGRPAGKK